MAELKRLRSSLQSSAEDFLAAVAKLNLKSSKPTLKPLIHSIPQSSALSSALPLALQRSVPETILSFKNIREKSPISSPSTSKSPPSKRLRRSARNSKTVEEPSPSSEGPSVDQRRQKILERLQVLAHVMVLCVSSPKKAFEVEHLLPAVKALHDNLILFESDSVLSAEIVSLCEEWWNEDLPERVSLISQFLPFLVSRSLALKKKVDVHRVYSLREAFTLFDFEDESIEDLKLLLIRCVIAPVYLKTEDGIKFVAFLFGLSDQLMKEALAIIRSQIPFGKKSMLEAYGDIIFRVWKGVEGDARDAIENCFLQGLIEGAIHASSRAFAAFIRRVLGGFINQRTVDGVEKVLFRLTEPVIFRSLQVANSNVRHNALHLLLDMFPLEDPDSTKEAKDSLLDKQFYLLEKLLFDDCPDIRAVAVEGSCRILHLFWEIIPSSTITNILTKIFDDMSRDICNAVRLSTLNGINYLMGNPESHEILKVLLPRIGRLLMDNVLSIRVAVADLLLLIRDIRAFQFNKVVGLDLLLPTLANDQPQVAQKITRLLTPSYFPSNVTSEEACSRCVTLLKRSPVAGAKFCEYVVAEVPSVKSLMELLKVLINLVVQSDELNEDQIEGFLCAASHLCKHFVNEPRYKNTLEEMFHSDRLKHLYSVAPTPLAQSSVFSLVSAIFIDDASGLIEECMGTIINCVGINQNVERQDEVRAAHKLLLSCNKIDDVLEAFTKLLQKTAFRCHNKFGIELPKHSVSSIKRKKSHSTVKLSAKWKAGEKKSSNFEEDYLIAIGVAWQIKDLLSDESPRAAILGYQNLEALLFPLKVIAEVSMLECSHSEYMDAYPVLAYTSLALHMSMRNSAAQGFNIRRSDGGSASGSFIETILDQTMDHLLNCAQKLFEASDAQPATSSPKSNEDRSRKTRSRGKKDRRAAADVSTNNEGALHASERSSCLMAKEVMMLTTILKFIVDTFTLGVGCCDSKRCLDFTAAFIQHILAFGQKFSVISRLEENALKETILCLKSTFTFALKLLNLVLKDPNETLKPLLEVFNLANCLLNLITYIELQFGSGYASSLLTALKPWLPDLIVALGSGYLLRETQQDASVSLFEHIKLKFPSWFSVLAEIVLEEIRETSSEAEEVGTSESEKHSVLQKFISMAVKMVAENRSLTDAIGAVLLDGSAIGLERNDCGLVLGLIRFVCVKLVREEDRHWGTFDMMLASLCRIFPQIEKRLEEGSSQGGQEKLRAALALLEPVWTYHLYESGRLSEMEEE
ncbi:uncharacterized protein LOC116199603 isoform X2 [Punica granatum]|uniref:Uncharacterized protein LOC116199603 isoform X2 n=1 Tax=Punica granatum TaxID=22663 RepID=A0A6P8D308_PUNGR|nr:uncharacterized protein LOC116199603 isoform X2 [Punica granatum]